MEFKITRENFLDGLTKTQGVVEKKSTIPVLSNVLLEADKKGLKISATDLEVAIVSHVPAQVLKDGKITVPSRSIFDIVREINQIEIQLALKDNDRIELRSGSSVFNIPGLKADDFPALPKIQQDSVELPCDVFLSMIEKTSFAMSHDETRQNLAGLFIEKSDGDGIRMVATDGHRLSLVDQDLGENNIDIVSVIIPKKGVNELKKIVSKEGTFELAIDKNNLLVRKGNETVFIRLIEGDFPDYRRVIPKQNGQIAGIPREEFIGALRRVSLLSNERSRGVVLTFSPGNLEVSINNPDLGEAREEMNIDYKGERISIGFNARYFLDVLQTMSAPTILIGLQNDLSPCMIKSENDKGFLSVIMPMRI